MRASSQDPAAAQRIQLQSQIPVQSISVSSLPNGQTLAHKPETKARPSGGQAAPNSGDVAALPACNIYSSEQCLQAQSFAHQTISQEAELQGNKTKPAAKANRCKVCRTSAGKLYFCGSCFGLLHETCTPELPEPLKYYCVFCPDCQREPWHHGAIIKAYSQGGAEGLCAEDARIAVDKCRQHCVARREANPASNTQKTYNGLRGDCVSFGDHIKQMRSKPPGYNFQLEAVPGVGGSRRSQNKLRLFLYLPWKNPQHDVISCPFQQTEAMPPKVVEPTNPTDQLSGSTSREQLSEAAHKQVGAVALWELRKAASEEDAPKQLSKTAPEQVGAAAFGELREAASDEDAPKQLSKTAPEQLSRAAPEQLSRAAPEQLSRAAPEQLSRAAPEQLSRAAPEQLREAVAAPEQLRDSAPEQLREAALESDEGPSNAGSTPCTADDIKGSRLLQDSSLMTKQSCRSSVKHHRRIPTDCHKSLSGNNNPSSPSKLRREQPISSILKRKASVIDLTKYPKPVSKCKYVPAAEVIDLTVDEPNVPLAAVPTPGRNMDGAEADDVRMVVVKQHEDMAKPVGDMSSQHPLLTDDPLMMDKCIVSQLHQLHQRCHRLAPLYFAKKAEWIASGGCTEELVARIYQGYREVLIDVNLTPAEQEDDIANYFQALLDP